MSKRMTETMKWDDKIFRRLPPEAKLLWLWLRDKCDMAGCLSWDSERAEFETKLTNPDITLNLLIKETQLIECNGDRIWLRDFIASQGNEHISPKNNVYKPFYEAVRVNANSFNGLSELLSQLESPFEAPCKGVARENSNSNSLSNKKEYGEFGKVQLSEEEYSKLVEKNGKEKADAGIAELDAWIERTGKRRKNHYACLNAGSWVWEKVKLAKPSSMPRYAPPVKWEHATVADATGRPE